MSETGEAHMRTRSSGVEIAVTPEMVDAGVRALYAYDNDPMWCSDEERVERIYRAMMKVARHSEELAGLIAQGRELTDQVRALRRNF